MDQNEPAQRICSPREVAAPRHRSRKPARALDDGVEHRLHVGRRAADDAEHLGGRRLMLQRLAQFLGSRVFPLQRFGEFVVARFEFLA